MTRLTAAQLGLAFDPATGQVRKARKPARRSVDHAATLAVHLTRHGVEGWVREHRFHASRKWRIDVAFVERRLAVEVDGGVWTGGRHSRGSGVMDDCEKFSALAIAGWRLIRVTPAHVRDGTAVQWIKQALEAT